MNYMSRSGRWRGRRQHRHIPRRVHGVENWICIFVPPLPKLSTLAKHLGNAVWYVTSKDAKHSGGRSTWRMHHRERNFEFKCLLRSTKMTSMSTTTSSISTVVRSRSIFILSWSRSITVIPIVRSSIVASLSAIKKVHGSCSLGQE